jgi:acetyl-CoA carboxylase biotin carboxylase subunit
MIQKILIANRGEIAVRVIKTARRLGIRTVAVYSRIDRGSLHVSMADEAYCIGAVELSETYLNIPLIIETAKRAGCDAVHPGYGFLAENPLFVKACDEAGLVFIGPDAKAMQVMGNKIEARAFARRINIPITEGVTGDKATLMATAREVGFPVLLKAAAGGGGKGMRVVHGAADLEDAIESTSRQAAAYFGDATVYIEKFIEDPRHIEFQIMGDQHGNVIHLFERECSIQRRYQKIIEESPSPTLTREVKQKMGAAAVRIGKEIGYSNAGTIEFLVDPQLNFYFLEMNTRIQVEHPVTELVTGIDIVEEQIRVASGMPLRFCQEDIIQQGHAIECRIYAEDPANNFRPSPGTMTLYREPELEGIRIDTGITAKTGIESSYDPMICKLISFSANREEATRVMIRALEEYIIQGIHTNITYLIMLLRHDAFETNTISTKFCDEHTSAIISSIADAKSRIPKHIPVIGYLLSSLTKRYDDGSETAPAAGIWKASGYWRDLIRISLTVEGTEITVSIPRHKGNSFVFEMLGARHEAVIHKYSGSRVDFLADGDYHTVFLSEDSGTNAFVTIDGHTFHMRRHDLLTESVTRAGIDASGELANIVTSPMPGKVIKILVKAGDKVVKGQQLLIIEAMKMENIIIAPREATIKTVQVNAGDRVDSSGILVAFEETVIETVQ